METNLIRVCFMSMIGAVALVLSACAADNRAWRYPPDPSGQALYTETGITLPYRLAVPPLKDERGAANETSSYWPVALPVVPYAERTFERPETLKDPEHVDTIVFDPPRDLSKAVASELQRAGIFSSVAYTEQVDPSNADFVLEGTLRSTTWSRRVTTYGFGGLGTVFWFLGAPIGTNKGALELDFRLVPVNDPSTTLWSFRMRFNSQHVEGPYYNLEESVLKYPRALQYGLEVAAQDLTRLAKERPESFQRAQKLARLTPIRE